MANSRLGSDPASTPRDVQHAWWGTVVLFLAHGLVVSTWISRIPAVQSRLHLANGILGLTLLSSAVGAVCTIPVTGILISRLGSKKVTVAASVAFCFALILPALAVNALTLAAALFVFGSCAAAMDVSMNAQGVEVEKQMGSPTMSRFHGMFSLGGMIGAAIGGAIASRRIAPEWHFTGSAVVNLFAVLAISGTLLITDRNPAVRERPLALRSIPPVLLALSAIGFCILLSEGAIADWTAVYLRQDLQAGPGTAAAGYAVFSAAMAIFRFLGDLTTKHLGPRRTVRDGSVVAAVGLAWALAMHSPGWAMPGFAAAGVGLSVIIPLVFGSGGRVESVSPGPGIATVTGIGYIGFIVGPPTIGFASQLVTLRFALLIVVGCCLISAILSPSLRTNIANGPAKPVIEPDV